MKMLEPTKEKGTVVYVRNRGFYAQNPITVSRDLVWASLGCSEKAVETEARTEAHLMHT